MIKICLLLLCCTFPVWGGEASFEPPEGWKKMDAKNLSPTVKMGFHTKSKKGLPPSLNLAVESVNVSIADYLKAVKNIYEKGKQCRWRDIGTIKTRAGEARLTEVDIQGKLGSVRLLQMIFLQDGHAYVVTGTALKEEFSGLYTTFQSAFQSFELE